MAITVAQPSIRIWLVDARHVSCKIVIGSKYSFKYLYTKQHDSGSQGHSNVRKLDVFAMPTEFLNVVRA